MSKYLQIDLEAYLHSVPEQEKTLTSLVFPLTHSAKEQGWRRLCKRSRPPIKDLHFHDLKHTAMTSFASPPIDLNSRQIAYMGDHKEARMSSRYEHLEMIESIRARLDIGYPEEHRPRLSAVTLPDLKKIATQGMKADNEKLANEKIAPFFEAFYKDKKTVLWGKDRKYVGILPPILEEVLKEHLDPIAAKRVLESLYERHVFKPARFSRKTVPGL